MRPVLFRYRGEWLCKSKPVCITAAGSSATEAYQNWLKEFSPTVSADNLGAVVQAIVKTFPDMSNGYRPGPNPTFGYYPNQ